MSIQPPPFPPPSPSHPPVAGWPPGPVRPPPPKKRRVWPWVAGGAVVVALMLVVVLTVAGIVVSRVLNAAEPPAPPAATPAPAGSPAPEPAGIPISTVKVGESMVWTRPDLQTRWTVVRVEQKTTADGGQAPQRGVFLLAYVRVVMVEGSIFACDCTLRFRTADGRDYHSDYAGFAGRPRLPAQTLTAGQTIDGWVPFDVPETALADGSIQWTPNLLDDDTRGFWRL